MKLLLLTPLFFLAACGTSSTKIASNTCNDVPSSVSESKTSQEEIVWKDLRIQQLMPGFMAFPAIDPCLPDNYINLPHPDMKVDGLFWGTKEALEELFKSGADLRVISPMLFVQISSSVGQKRDGTFTNEDTIYDSLIACGCSDVKIDKLKWGEHPILSTSFTRGGKKEYIAWAGLNYEGHVLMMRFLDVSKPNASSEDTSRIWTDFLTKSRPLVGLDFYKLHGQDFRLGFTLVNVYGSVLKVSAEKRTRDGKIQVSIQPADHTISCKCLAIDQKAMPAEGDFPGSVVKIQAEVQVSSTANIVSRQTITVLPKEVLEFSHREMDASVITEKELNNISVLNFCDKDVVNKPEF